MDPKILGKLCINACYETFGIPNEIFDGSFNFSLTRFSEFIFTLHLQTLRSSDLALSFFFLKYIYIFFSYFSGIRMNALDSSRLYPGFSMRIYHDKTWSDDDGQMEELCQIACQHTNVDLCSAWELGNISYLK